MAQARKETVLSVRMGASTHERLEARGRASGGKSALALRYIEEGLRTDEHPGIVFRLGPAGRRPGLAAGTDVWEIIQALENVEARGEAAIAATAEWMGLELFQVEVAVGYYADYSQEIDEWLDRVQREAAEAEDTWRRRLDALA
jgi:hypothetical protein